VGYWPEVVRAQGGCQAPSEAVTTTNYGPTAPVSQAVDFRATVRFDQLNGGRAMSFDSKKAVDAWKKAKPLLLTDTGVSDFLRKLPTNPPPPQLGLLVKAQKELDGYLKDPKIKGEKKAAACLQQIKADIENHLDEVAETRKLVVKNMETILSLLDDYLKTMKKGVYTRPIVMGYRMKVEPALKNLEVVQSNKSNGAIPEEMFKYWIAGVMNTRAAFNGMENLLMDSERTKPVLDMKKGMPNSVADMEIARNLMDKSRKTVKALG
jgi:hypothetical protein